MTRVARRFKSRSRKGGAQLEENSRLDQVSRALKP